MVFGDIKYQGKLTQNFKIIPNDFIPVKFSNLFIINLVDLKIVFYL